MKLYSGPLSLFARKIEIALREKGLAFEREMVPFTQTAGYAPKHPEVVAANPKQQVPVLVDQGLVLYDSTVILEYLEDAYPLPPLYPRTAQARARCRLWDVFADEVMLVPLRALMHRTGPRPADPGQWERAQAAALPAEALLDTYFAQLDTALTGQPFLCGDSPGAADIAIFMAVYYSGRLGGPVPDGHPALAGWYTRLLARPAFQAVVDEIAAADRALSQPVARRGQARA